MKMDTETISVELLEFFKALADENRLKIIGLLAQAPRTVEELAELLGLRASTVSHHLSRLSHAGLVSARPQGHYFFYSLQLEALRGMAIRLLSEETLPRLSGEVDIDAYDRKVLETFTDPEGRILAFPAQEKKFQVLLRHVVKAFEPGLRFSEKQVNEILGKYHEDTAQLRRGLVEYKLMARQGGGGEYWRI
jgi:predicted transcriptional regulator